LLSLGWAVNTLSVTAYFFNLGTGSLKWNTVSHVSTALLNATFGTLFGLKFGGIGVAIATVCSLMIPSMLIIIMFHRESIIELTEIFDSSQNHICLASFLGLAFGFFLYSIGSLNDYITIKSICATAFLIIFVLSASFESPYAAMIRSRISRVK